VFTNVFKDNGMPFLKKKVSDQFSNQIKKTGKITVQYILIFTLNKMYMHNNNLLQKSPFGRLSR